VEWEPVEWRVVGLDRYSPWAVRIQVREQRDGSVRYVVAKDGDVLCRDGTMVWEPQPSSRTDEFIAATRYDSLEEAQAAYERATAERAAKRAEARERAS
jgi:hypothetical protein